VNSASMASRKSGSPKPDAKPIVFVVDDDVSVRESLEGLISFAGWQPEIFCFRGRVSRSPADDCSELPGA